MNFDLKKLQGLQLKTLVYLAAFLKENGLRYFMLGGTFLGSIRHEGFIPWDDDVDLGMPRDDYEKFLDIADKLPKSLYIQSSRDPKSHYLFSKVRIKNTIITEDEYSSKKYNGVFIDIFPIDGAGNTYKEAVKHTKKLIFLRKIYNNSIYRSNFKTKGLLKRIGQLGFRFFSILIPPGLIRRKIDRLVKKYPYEKSEFVTMFSGSFGLRDIFKKSIFGNGDSLSLFEGHLLSGPTEAKLFLEQQYGDYMTPPAPEKRVGHITSFVDMGDNDF